MVDPIFALQTKVIDNLCKSVHYSTTTCGYTVYGKIFEGRNFRGCTEVLQFAGKYSRLYIEFCNSWENIRGSLAVLRVKCEDTWQSINPYESVSRPLDRSVMDHEEEFSTEGEIHGYHVYQAIWTPVIDEVLECVREEDNDEDRFAVAVKKSSTIVGHLP